MSLPPQTLKRLPNIKKGLLTGLNYQQIGDSVGVTEKTIDRDVHTWLNSGDFETWVKEEWVRLHNQIIHDNPTEAYKQVSRIIGKMVTRKQEAHIVEEVTIDEKHVTIIADYNRAVEAAVNRDLAALRARQHVDTPQPNAEAG